MSSKLITSPVVYDRLSGEAHINLLKDQKMQQAIQENINLLGMSTTHHHHHQQQQQHQEGYNKSKLYLGVFLSSPPSLFSAWLFLTICKFHCYDTYRLGLFNP
jgi:hypothetical protein